jgi:quinolinate synthase
MARIGLEKILEALETRAPHYRVEIDEELRVQALRPIRRMLELP